MKKSFLILVLSFAIAGLAQTPAPKPAPVRPRPHPINPMTFKQAVVNQPFAITLPALAGETGCGLQIFGNAAGKTGWKLSGQTFSGTPTVAGFYHLKISCTTPNAVNQVIMLRVDKTAPPTPKPVAPPPVIPLN